MSGDLSPTALAELAELEIGSQCDHNAMQRENAERLRAAHEPAPWALFLVIALALGAAYIAVGWYVAGPPPLFNFFSR